MVRWKGIKKLKNIYIWVLFKYLDEMKLNRMRWDQL